MRATDWEICITVEPDESPDTSYLDQREFHDRRAAYDRGEFSFVGVRAIAHNWEQGVTAKSAGLWGVESDSSPHPKDFRAPVIAAIAECETICEHVHLPLQSGSSQVLKRMRRTYDRSRYLRLVDALRTAIPDVALGTDLIVGFPGETDAEFEETLAAVEEVRFDSAFTFIFSPRSGTEAAAMPGQVPEDVKHRRLETLVEVV